MDVGAAADSNAPAGSAPFVKRFDSATNTFGDGSHAGSRGGHTGLGSAEAGSADADFYSTYRAVRLNSFPISSAQS